MAKRKDGTPLTPATIRRDGRPPRKAMQVERAETDDETERQLADAITSPDMAASRVIAGTEAKSGIGELIDVPHLTAALRRQAEAVNSGDLKLAEAMLMNQATALQSLFARLAERAMSHNSIPGFDANMRMALRAQSQCRATIEALAMIKNPPIVYAKQANVTTGPQQVNNGVVAPARETESKTNKLLEAEHGERLDTRAPSTAVGSDQALETVGAVHGAEDA